jgi:acyl-CoA-dependent ceramide synthase
MSHTGPLRVVFATDLFQYIYYKSPYFLNMQELWTDWPQRELNGLIKGYILAQWSYCIQEVFVINIEDRRKDHWQMLTHHFVTIALISSSYTYHQTRVGSLILVLMDVIDVFLPVSPAKSHDM